MLSEVDRRFLLATAHDDAESKLTDIANSLGATTRYAGVYRQRLLRAGMILPAAWGRITLAHHAARCWLPGLPGRLLCATAALRGGTFRASQVRHASRRRDRCPAPKPPCRGSTLRPG